LTANAGGKAYIPFKKSATGRVAGSSLWKKMFHYFPLNHDEFMDHYHKHKFAETLKSKNTGTNLV